MKFHEVPIGAPFTLRGQTYTKTALSVGQDAIHIANVFQYETDVESETKNPDPAAGFPTWEGTGHEKSKPGRVVG